MAALTRTLLGCILAAAAVTAVVANRAYARPQATPSDSKQTSRWGVAGIDEVRPSVNAGVECPQQRVIDEAGNRLTELAENISRFDAVEEIVHEEQNAAGKALARVARRYAYVAVVKSLPSGASGRRVPIVDETRRSDAGSNDALGGIRTSGLATLAFVFHPAMRDTFALVCEGLGEWHGQPAWLVHFRQRADSPNYLQEYKVSNRFYPVALKGRAWVDANKFQVVHMEAELAEPVPEITLLTEHYIVDYGLVRFQKKNAELWLPKNAELYFHFRGRRYYRRHSFDNFRLFSVDSTQEISVPKGERPPALQ